MSNWIVALTNMPAILPIWQSVINQDYLTTACIGFVSFMSFVSHLVENHKHGMPGIGYTKNTLYVLNRLDVVGAVSTGLRFMYLYYVKFGFSVKGIIEHPYLAMGALIAFLLLRISEYDKYNVQLRTMYMITHSLWHVSIFVMMYYFLQL